MRQADLPGFHEISSDVATISQDRGWKTFLLSGYGFKSPRQYQAVPADLGAPARKSPA